MNVSMPTLGGGFNRPAQHSILNSNKVSDWYGSQSLDIKVTCHNTSLRWFSFILCPLWAKVL